jgi:ketosteroid isomerase-like protein
MTTQEIADDLAAMCRRGEFRESGEKYWADEVLSVEPFGDMAEVRGIDGARGKGDWWEANHEVHDIKVDGPWVNGDHFTVRYAMDVTSKADGRRTQMDEIALYTLKGGKIVEERFFYSPPTEV